LTEAAAVVKDQARTGCRQPDRAPRGPARLFWSAERAVVRP